MSALTQKDHLCRLKFLFLVTESVSSCVLIIMKLYIYIHLDVTSPNYPDSFNLTDLNCKWTFKALHGAKVQVQLVDSDLNDGCFDNILTVVDDTPTTMAESSLKFPGKSAHCGQNDFGPKDMKHQALGDVVTVTFKSSKNNGHATFKLVVTSIVPSKDHLCSLSQTEGCPNGPCCAGPDCCIIHPGPDPEGIPIFCSCTAKMSDR